MGVMCACVWSVKTARLIKLVSDVPTEHGTAAGSLRCVLVSHADASLAPPHALNLCAASLDEASLKLLRVRNRWEEVHLPVERVDLERHLLAHTSGCLGLSEVDEDWE